MGSLDPRLAISTTLLGELPKGRLLDLACGTGIFSVIAQQMGWDVTAVDVRTARMPHADGVRWIQSDVRDFEVVPGAYNCILVFGLLYHLELKDVLDLLGRCSHTLTIVDTHFTLAPDHEELGYRGTTFDELQGRTLDQVARGGMKSSYGNPTSFWPDEESLIRILYDSGFGHVYKHAPSYREDRAFFICFPPKDHRETVARAWAIINGEQERPARRGLFRARKP